MKTTIARNPVTLLTFLSLVCGQAAFADPSRDGAAPPRVVTKSHQPVGPPHKASSFAPHPTSKRVFGDPIQPPIMGHVAPRKPDPPK